jgi:hypothetical protein
MVARAGVQPATFALGVRCSMQLSYRAKIKIKINKYLDKCLDGLR